MCQSGGGAHVANCGYITAPAAQGRVLARSMLDRSLTRAKERGSRAMQFNLVVSTSVRATRTWDAYGFAMADPLPLACLGHIQANLRCI
jgi:GNAT superfamily N-acetyltransferase